MIEFKIKTWSCSECGYQQDFEPTVELMKEHIGNASDNCPSCGQAKLKKETVVEKKMVMRVQQDDVEHEEIDYDTNSEPKRDNDGKIKKKMVLKKGLTDAEVAELKAKYEDK